MDLVPPLGARQDLLCLLALVAAVAAAAQLVGDGSAKGVEPSELELVGAVIGGGVVVVWDRCRAGREPATDESPEAETPGTAIWDALAGHKPPPDESPKAHPSLVETRPAHSVLRVDGDLPSASPEFAVGASHHADHVFVKNVEGDLGS